MNYQPYGKCCKCEKEAIGFYDYDFEGNPLLPLCAEHAELNRQENEAE